MSAPIARRRSLMARLVLTFLALSLLMVGIVGSVSYLRARDSLETTVFDRLSAAEQLKADSIDRWIDELTGMMPEAANDDDHDRLLSVLDEEGPTAKKLQVKG